MRATAPAPAATSIPGPIPAGPYKPAADAHHPTKVRPGVAAPRDNQPSSIPAVNPAPDKHTAALLPAARAVRDELGRDGLPLTRAALAVRLRQRGHPIRNASLTLVLHQLRHERPTDHVA